MIHTTATSMLLRSLDSSLPSREDQASQKHDATSAQRFLDQLHRVALVEAFGEALQLIEVTSHLDHAFFHLDLALSEV